MSVVADGAYQRGLDLTLAREYSAAIASFEEAASRFPDDPAASKELGMAYIRRAEAIVPDALKQRDTTSDKGGNVLSSLGDAVQAALGLAVVRASQAIGQTDWIVRYRDDFRRAAEALRRSTELAEAAGVPEPDTYFALAQALRYLGRTDSARDAALRAMELAPDDEQFAARARALDLESGIGTPGVRRVTWNDVVLPQKTKRELRQMQLMIEDPKLAASLGVEPPTGLLLYGPPGTGKTTIARVLASEAKCEFFATSPAEINSMWLGESEKQVKRLFDQARAAAPSIIFLDEIDALLPSRSGGYTLYSDKVVNQFLHEMDGLKTNRRVFVVGATNRRDMLDPALLRGGRLSREIEIPLPDLNARKELLELYMAGANTDETVDTQSLAQRTNGMSGADIKAFVNEAGLQALIRISENPDQARLVNHTDFEEALANTAPAQQPPPSPFMRGWT